MSSTSAIEWTQMTWNPTVGCTRVTAGCEHCYAFLLHDRRHAIYQQHNGYWNAEQKVAMPRQYAHPFSTVQVLPERLEAPLHEKRPRMIFVDSMSDLFHSAIADDTIKTIFEVMQQAYWHTFQILTKRSGRLRRLGQQLDWPPNVWMGVSIERDALTPRADALRAVPAAVRFISAEPLLGPLPSLNLDGIHWLITGGESGPDARPCDPEWVRNLRDQCVGHNIPFFHKQWGGRTPKSGGRELDGRTWDEFPVLKTKGEAMP